MKLVEVDLTRGEKNYHPDVVLGADYLARIRGGLFVGKFCAVWFGLHFADGYGASGGHQFNTPGYNNSGWEKLWQIVDDES